MAKKSRINSFGGISNVSVDISLPNHPFLASDGIPNKLFPLILADRLNSLKPSINIPLEQTVFCVSLM